MPHLVASNQVRSLDEFKVEDPNYISQLTDICNKKGGLQAAQLKINSSTQALILVPEEREDWFQVLENNLESRKITRLFTRHLFTFHELLQENHELIILDCA
ncbi:hypothetical protein K3495_g9665 [Podosphaera aphanis]|nr:hypothetical protein K3495_g9665 [Podosphaera aphanis]